MKKQLIAGGVVVMMVCSPAWAQKLPEYESTGTMQLTVDGTQKTYHTTANTVPNQPGRMIHTARWKIFAPMMMGGINIAPPGIFVSLVARPAIEPDPNLPDLKITFFLDQEKYSLLDSSPIEVVYVVKDGSLAGQYRHAIGSLKIDSATMVQPDLMEISGTVAGTLSKETDKRNKKDAGQTLSYEAIFSARATRY